VLWSGRQTDHPEIDRLLRYLEFVQPGPETSKLAGVWRAEARARGRSLDLPDALIAASAYHLDAAVLTRNVRDFELTPVRIETY
jgi:predicted nucleic acid-binding protein